MLIRSSKIKSLIIVFRDTVGNPAALIVWAIPKLKWTQEDRVLESFKVRPRF